MLLYISGRGKKVRLSPECASDFLNGRRGKFVTDPAVKSRFLWPRQSAYNGP
jgi:hypothetical protein